MCVGCLPTLLPQPMMFFGTSTVALSYTSNGFVGFRSILNQKFGGFANIYFMDMDTGNCGTDQNQIWLRVGNKTSDLLLARDIIAGNGTLFNPQVVMIATWYKVEAYYQRAGPKNTFQLIIAYSETGAPFGIHAYTQLNSNTTMNQLQNRTNCNRKGIYVYRINAGSTNAPTKAPTKSHESSDQVSHESSH
jgi:hypothetical protein